MSLSPDNGLDVVIYSLLYNGGYMLFNTIIAVVVIFILQKAARKLIAPRTNPSRFPGRLFKAARLPGGGRETDVSLSPARKHTAAGGRRLFTANGEAKRRFAHRAARLRRDAPTAKIDLLRPYARCENPTNTQYLLLLLQTALCSTPAAFQCRRFFIADGGKRERAGG